MSKPKSILKSRTVAVLSTATAVVLVRWLGNVLPYDLAKAVADALSDEIIAAVVTAATALSVRFKHQDYAAVAAAVVAASKTEAPAPAKKKKTVAEILAEKN
jgi:integral membrane sensor domain MASE1